MWCMYDRIVFMMQVYVYRVCMLQVYKMNTVRPSTAERISRVTFAVSIVKSIGAPSNDTGILKIRTE